LSYNNKITSQLVLDLFRRDGKFRVETNISGHAIREVLAQRQKGKWKPIVFYQGKCVMIYLNFNILFLFLSIFLDFIFLFLLILFYFKNFRGTLLQSHDVTHNNYVIGLEHYKKD